jgi:hypothetical protein
MNSHMAYCNEIGGNGTPERPALRTASGTAELLKSVSPADARRARALVHRAYRAGNIDRPTMLTILSGIPVSA